MYIEKIILRDFGCFHGKQDFELTEGINLIFGPNFSGKSTLVNTIFFTLTGKPIVPRIDAAAMKHANAYTGTAGLQFARNGYQYQLFRATAKRIQLRAREQQQQNSRWEILFDEQRVTVVETELQKRFGFAHQHLALTAFLREGEIFEFLARQSATRRDILYTLLGIDTLIAVRERFIDARRLAKREENRIRSHQNSLRFSAQQTHTAEIQKIEENIKKLEAEYGAHTSDTELIAEWTQRQNQLKTQLAALAHEQTEVLSGFNNSDELREMIHTIQNAIDDSTGLNAKRDALIQQIGSTKSHIATLQTICDTLRRLLQDNSGHCPTCYQKVEPQVVQRIIDEKESQKSELQTQLNEQEQTLDKQSEELNARTVLEQRLRLLHTRQTRSEQLAQTIPKIQTELTTLEARLSERGIAAEATDEPRNRTGRPVDKSQLKIQIDKERKRLDQLKQKEAVRLDRHKELQRVNTAAAAAQQTRLSLELACDGIDKTIQTLQHQILEPVELELHQWIQNMQLFGSSLDKGRVDLQRQHLLPSLTIDGVDRSLMLLSGSEKMFLYLCFKVALAKVLGNPGFFVFDDPTLHLDAQRKALMVDFIQQLAKEHQVIVTSYDEEVRTGLEDAHLIEIKSQPESEIR